jgi:hypothetical protein
MAFYIIKSSINLKDPSNVVHEILDINEDVDESNTLFDSLIKEIPKKNKPKRTDNNVSYNEDGNIITIQIHQHIINNDDDNNNDNFIDDDNDDEDEDDNDDNENKPNMTKEFLNFQPNMSPVQIHSYMNRVTGVVSESNKQTLTITEKYNKIVSKNKHLLCNNSGKSLDVSFK